MSHLIPVTDALRTSTYPDLVSTISGGDELISPDGPTMQSIF